MLVVPVFMLLMFQSKSSYDRVSIFELKYLDIRGAFGKFFLIYKPYHVWYHFKELSFFFVITQIL